MINELLKDFQLYHSEFQIIHFILKGSSPTKYGIYKQCLRELDKRYKAIKELKIQLDSSNNEKLDYINQSGKDLIREFEIIYKVAVSLKQEIGELTNEKRKDLEYELWEATVKTEMAKDLYTIGMLSKDTLNMISALPSGMKKKVIRCMESDKTVENLKLWYINNDVKLPDYENIKILDTEVLKCLNYCQ